MYMYDVKNPTRPSGTELARSSKRYLHMQKPINVIDNCFLTQDLPIVSDNTGVLSVLVP